MKKLPCALLFSTTRLIGQNGQGQPGPGAIPDAIPQLITLLTGQNGQDQNGKKVRMPEPSAIPELILCVGAIGFLAWRQRKAVLK
jgi:hypothetical protein